MNKTAAPGSRPPLLAVDENADIAVSAACAVVGHVPLRVLTRGLSVSAHHRPRAPYPPAPGRRLPDDAPAGLTALYNIAARDMRRLGHDPDRFYLYTLYHAGPVAPGDALRAGFWHFDLRRLLRERGPGGTIPVAIGYGVSSDFPTIYATRLAVPDGGALPARATIEDEAAHDRLGAIAAAAGFTFQPQPGDVVRYDTLVLHRGAPNRHAAPRHRVFMHVAFSPA